MTVHLICGIDEVGRGPLAGPDLQGVTAQRDRQWLARWLAGRWFHRSDPLPRPLAAALVAAGLIERDPATGG